MDLRFTRGITLMGSKVALFADVRNLLNSQNQTDVYGYTGSPTDPGDINAEALGAAGDDRVIAEIESPVERLQFQRQQETLKLYGIADADDAVLTTREQQLLLALGYVHSQRIETFFSAPRRMRLGFEWVF